MSEPEEQGPAAEPPDVGPDPVWGLSIGIAGLITMAIGGAATWHWVFNIGEGTMLLGAAIFFVCVARAHLKQRAEPEGGRVAAALASFAKMLKRS